MARPSFIFALILLVLYAPFFQSAHACPFDMHSGDVTQTTAYVQASFNHASCRPRPTAGHAVGRFLYYSSRKGRLQLLGARNVSVVSFAGLDAREFAGGYVAKVRLGGLSPGKRYAYRFVSPSGKRSPLGQFHTIPARGPVRFVVLTQLNRPPFNLVRHAHGSKPHFGILNGDGVYGSKPWVPGSRAVPSRSYYRGLYASEQRSVAYGGGAWVPRLLRTVATYAIADDHEVTSDWAGVSGQPRVLQEGLSKPIARDRLPRRRVSALVRLGLGTFEESYAVTPANVLSRTDPVGSVYDTQARLFRRFSIPGADVFLLDLRQYRDPPIPTVSLVPVLPKGVGPNFTCVGPYAHPVLCAVLPGPHGTYADMFRGRSAARRTILGRAQYNWLTSGLRHSTNKFKIVLSTCIFGNVVVDVDEGWHGYWAERTRLLRFIARHKIDNVVFLSSGLLGAMATRIDPDKSQPGKHSVHELVSGPAGSFSPGAELGSLVSYVEDFVRTFAEDSHLKQKDSEKAVRFAVFDQPNLLNVQVSNGTLTAEWIGRDGGVMTDRKGNVGRMVLG